MSGEILHMPGGGRFIASRKLNLEELEAVLNREEDFAIVVLPNGEIRSTSDEALAEIMAEKRAIILKEVVCDKCHGKGTVKEKP